MCVLQEAAATAGGHLRPHSGSQRCKYPSNIFCWFLNSSHIVILIDPRPRRTVKSLLAPKEERQGRTTEWSVDMPSPLLTPRRAVPTSRLKDPRPPMPADPELPQWGRWVLPLVVRQKAPPLEPDAGMATEGVTEDAEIE